MPSIGTFIPDDLKCRLESKCAKENKTCAGVLRELIFKYLEEQETTDNTLPIALMKIRDSLTGMKGEKIVGVTSQALWYANDFIVWVVLSGGCSLYLSSRSVPCIRTKEETNARLNETLSWHTEKAEELAEIRKEINMSPCTTLQSEAWICNKCGFSGKGIVPEKCPACSGEKFDDRTDQK